MRPWPLLLSPLLALLGCPVGAPEADDDDSTSEPTPCAYPEGAVEPMALGEVLTPHSWPTALHADGRVAPLSLERAHCNEDDIDWSPFDVLLFVSIPAW